VSALFTAADLANAAGGVMTRPFHAAGVSIDTRTIQPGDIFVALETDARDGHDFVAEALHKGAAGAMVHRQDGMPDAAPLLVVGDTLAGLTSLGAYARTRFTGSVVAITGSVGKTTAKEMLRVMLGACGRTHAAQASYNNHWGVPLTLARMPPDFDYAVIEIGMNHPGEIAPLARLASPDVALITTVASAHIGHMGSLEAIADEKASIAQGVLQGGALVVPANAGLRERMAACADRMRVLSFSDADLRAVSEDADGSDVLADIAGHAVRFRIEAPGRHMVMNALAALTSVVALGAPLDDAVQALRAFRPVAGRGVRRAIMGGRATLLDESYNASGASMRAALSVLKLQKARRRVAVLGDMLELGDHSRAEHLGLADAVEDCADVLYACGPWSRVLFDAVPPRLQGGYAPDSHALAKLLLPNVQDGDTILVKGSLGSRMRAIVDALENAG
jgi:UDP-N-acetylmuramoyl-tripeptide--D-alanyl-D-alanine ligase